MTSRGEEIRRWFERAASVPAPARQALLHADCEDPEVRAEVLSLLEYDGGGDSEWDICDSVAKVLGEIARASEEVDRVGAFRLGKLLGAGGMGLVYEGHRVDGEVRHVVAVKLPHVPPGSTDALRTAVYRRFARERQTLAGLRHPYIAGLIDAGTTAGGAPYAVIEQVDGVPIDRYCDAHLPDIAGRIQVFLKLCDAVRFAHGNLIIHGDIKPDNVLVTSDGIPKLIDFGVASDLSDGGGQTCSRAFTPEYSSPEQMLGARPSVPADIYSLGAVLYRLLTGSQVRDAESARFIEAVRNDRIVPPSVLRPQLKGDLENILLKSLHPEPHRRYGSVPEFADDLVRYLEGRTVRATPDSLWYRSRRFARRHWQALAVVAALALTLACAAVFAAAERSRELQNATESRRLANRLLFDIHDDIGGILGATRARERLSTIALGYLESLEKNHWNDPELTWDLFNALIRLACDRSSGSSSVGDAKGGLQLASKALELAPVVEASSRERGRLASLFDAYHDLAGVFHEAGRPAQHREVIDRMLRLSGQLDATRKAKALVTMARYLDDHGQESEAARAYGRALATLRSFEVAALSGSEVEAQLISTLIGFGRAQAVAGEFADAAASLREAIARSERRVAFHPDSAADARRLYWSRIALGDVFGNPGRFHMGRPQEAAAEYRKARAIAERHLKGDPHNEVARTDLVRALNREAAALSELEPGRAVALFDRARVIMSGAGSDGRSSLEARAAYLTSAVAPLLQAGYVDRARVHAAQAREVFERMQKSGMKPNAHPVLRAEAMLLHHLGQRKEALARAQEQLALLGPETKPVLSANYEKIRLLERMRAWSNGFDPAVYAMATKQLAATWSDLKAAHPASAFVKEQSRFARALPQQR